VGALEVWACDPCLRPWRCPETANQHTTRHARPGAISRGFQTFIRLHADALELGRASICVRSHFVHRKEFSTHWTPKLLNERMRRRPARSGSLVHHLSRFGCLPGARSVHALTNSLAHFRNYTPPQRCGSTKEGTQSARNNSAIGLCVYVSGTLWRAALVGRVYVRGWSVARVTSAVHTVRRRYPSLK
jgi:hypothetical protein